MARILKEKKKETKDERLKKCKMGSPSTKERHLTVEQKHFAQLVARGGEPRTVGRDMGLSDYKIDTYMNPDKWPQLHLMIDQYKEIYTQKGIDKYAERIDMLNTVVIDEVIRRVEHKEVSEAFLKQLLDNVRGNVLKGKLKLSEESTEETEEPIESQQIIDVNNIKPKEIEYDGKTVFTTDDVSSPQVRKTKTITKRTLEKDDNE